MNNFQKTLDVLTEAKDAKSITIEKDGSTGEYRVPAQDGKEAGATYTDDKQDAIDTAKSIYGDDVKIKFRSVAEFVGGKYEDKPKKKAAPKKKPAVKKPAPKKK